METPSPVWIVATLEPWQATFRAARFSTTLHDTYNANPTIEFHLEPPFSNLREALELLRLAMVINPNTLRMLVDKRWICSHDTLLVATAFEPPADSVVAFNVVIPGALRVDFDLDVALSSLLFNHTASSSQFHHVRDLLLQKLAISVRDDVATQPLCIHCGVFVNDPSSQPLRYSELKPTPNAAQLLFQRLLNVLQRAEHSKSTPGLLPADLRLVLHLDAPVSITTKTVKLVDTLMATGQVECKHVVVDPREIMCSTAALTKYLRSLLRDSRRLRIETGYVVHRFYDSRIDVHVNQYKGEVINSMMQALGSCGPLYAVDFSQLVLHISRRRNREAFWTALLQHFLTPENPTPVQELRLSLDYHLMGDEMKLMKSLVAFETRPRRSIKYLFLKTKDDSAESIMTILDLVRDVSKLEWKPPRSSGPLVRDILTLCPSLRSVRLHNWDSLPLDFLHSPPSTPTGSRLEKLELVKPRDGDQACIARFLCALQDTDSWLATTLRSFKIVNAPASCYLNPVNAALLENLLQTNRTLRVVNLPMQDQVPATTRAALRSHVGDVIPHPLPQEPVELRRRFAFLGLFYTEAPLTVFLPSAVVQSIFELARPHKTRVLRLLYNGLPDAAAAGPPAQENVALRRTLMFDRHEMRPILPAAHVVP